MKGTEFDPPPIKFEGSTDDSQLEMQFEIYEYKGMNNFVTTFWRVADLSWDWSMWRDN